MSDYASWWRQLPKRQRGLWLIACYVLIFYGAMDVGHAIHQATH